jgi:uncharacterized UBP type Zn finger protein
LEQLLEMGFDKARAERALQESGGDISIAVQLLDAAN